MTIKQSPPCFMVRESGFEPLKDKPADLQSAAFVHLAIPPYVVHRARLELAHPGGHQFLRLARLPFPPSVHCGGIFWIRTRDAQNFNLPLYQLS